LQDSENAIKQWSVGAKTVRQHGQYSVNTHLPRFDTHTHIYTYI